MGLFDAWRRRGAGEGGRDAAAELSRLRAKYRDVLAAVESEEIRVQSLYAAEGRLVLKGVAPSESARTRILEEARRAAAGTEDIVLDLAVSSR
jgi:hypothetical protein